MCNYYLWVESYWNYSHTPSRPDVDPRQKQSLGGRGTHTVHLSIAFLFAFEEILPHSPKEKHNKFIVHADIRAVHQYLHSQLNHAETLSR